MRAATSADALIITNGLWKGVNRLIGEAAHSLRYQQTAEQNRRVQLLGISSWGVLQEQEALLNKTHPSNPRRYRVYDNNENDKVPASLEPNHHAFLLADFGTKKYGDELTFRSELEDAIIQQYGVAGVLLVLEGGETTLTTTLECVRKGRPVVVVDGLGGCGDLLAYAYGISENMSGGQDDYGGFEKIMNRDCPHWKRYLHFKTEADESKADSKMKRANMLLFEACVLQRDFVSVVKLGDASTLDSAILEANFKAAGSKKDPLQLLGLAVQWNQTSIAQKYVFTSNNMSNPEFFAKLNENSDFFLNAVKRNYFESASALIMNGFDPMGKYFTDDTLCELYQAVLCVDSPDSQFLDESLRSIINNLIKSPKSSRILLEIGQLLDDLIPGTFPNIYDTEETRQPTWPSFTGNNKVHEASSRTVSIAMSTSEPSQHSFVIRDLFVYCLLLNRQKMARLMWNHFDQGGALAGAVFGAAILKGLANEANAMVELAESLKEHANYWENTASEFAEHCFQRDQTLAHRLLIRTTPEFGHKTPFEIAHAAHLEKFMGTSCCYTKLNANWRDQINLNTSLSLIMATTFLPFLMPLVKFRPPDEEKKLFTDSNAESKSSIVLYRKVGWKTTLETVAVPKAFRLFYGAPVTKFFASTLSYLIYLVIYSIFILTDNFRLSKITNLEIVLWVWTVVMMLEETRQIFTSLHSLRIRLEFFWSNWWHRLDILAFLLFLTASLCHIGRVSVQDWTAIDDLKALDTAIIDLYNLALVLFFLRLLSFFYVSQSIGPRVITLFKMTLDVGFFAAIYVVLVFAFGVPIQSMVYPQNPLHWQLIEAVFYDYILIMLDINEHTWSRVSGEESETCIAWNRTADSAEVFDEAELGDRCPQLNYLAVALFLIHVIAIIILLLNLLVAIFT